MDSLRRSLVFAEVARHLEISRVSGYAAWGALVPGWIAGARWLFVDFFFFADGIAGFLERIDEGLLLYILGMLDSDFFERTAGLYVLHT